MPKATIQSRQLKNGNLFVSISLDGRGSMSKVTDWLNDGNGKSQSGIWGLKLLPNNTLTFYTKQTNINGLKKIEQDILRAYADPH